MSSKNITFDSNIIGHVVDRTTIEAGDGFVDKSGGVSVCAYFEPDDTCENISVTNNLAGGVVYAGFVGTLAHTCGDTTSTSFKNNIAHSVKGISSGAGAYINKVPSDAGQATCMEISDFKAYKTYYTPFFSYGETKKIIINRMTFIDNRVGFTANIKNKP